MIRIRLFTSVFPEKREVRTAEYAECLRRNLECEEIDEVVVLVEGSSDISNGPKLTCLPVNTRPSYADYLARIRAVAEPEDVSIIANSDIYFDEGIGVLRYWRVPSNTVLALSRWESTSADPYLNYRNDSQDAWIFRGPPLEFKADFPVGVPRCDNRLVKELELAGYAVQNPAFSIRAYHLHDEVRGEYPTDHREDFVEGPYGYVWPHNLMSLPGALWHNIRHRRQRIGWRVDRRSLSRALKIHSLRNAVRASLPPR